MMLPKIPCDFDMIKLELVPEKFGLGVIDEFVNTKY